ncbi:MAG: glycosyltransferase [Chloroflexaceae bacterium]|jgi:glycosyltransferase involved in cell wall biosynthesis|nr:glycosyltransferase [Chloroflexaceae bacterium]
MNNDSPLVTIIVPTYNSSATLVLTLRGILAQELTDYEVWVVGDGCSDDSGAVVAAFNEPRFHWYNLPFNSTSQSGPNNEGLRRARGRYIAYSNHDDLWLPWHLSGLLHEISSSGADLVHALVVLLGPNGRVEAQGAPPPHHSYATHFITPSGWLHRRELVDECGFWPAPQQTHSGVDFDYLRRIYRAGKTIRACRQMSVLHLPSLWWKTYSMQGVPPQQAYLEELLTNPRQLEARLLMDMALALGAVRPDDTPSALGAWLTPLRWMWRQMTLHFDDQRWPLFQMQSLKYQLYRRRMRSRRGLAPLKRRQP